MSNHIIHSPDILITLHTITTFIPEPKGNGILSMALIPEPISVILLENRKKS